jgi:dihydrofolate reductase
MSRLRVNAYSISIDGFGAGPDQSLENPMGIGGMALHQWVLGTRTFQRIHADPSGAPTGSEGVDDRFAARGFENLGAWILGRNMFGPIRGPWPDDAWKGCWGENPPYHVPVFVLTHHARAPITMAGGGAATIRQYLAAGLIDELHLALSPVLLGRGEHLLAGIDTVKLGYRCTEHAATEHATHLVLTK